MEERDMSTERTNNKKTFKQTQTYQ